ncbi:MAG: amidohydrolase family protein, partial [Firmicutes bacterium]|nr:amidohydrolase family protein [Bacillota bacterium]
QVAQGQKKADVVLKGGAVVDVLGCTQFVADVAIVDEMIVGVGKYKGKVEIDCAGKFVTPGFVDSHMHIESTALRPSQLAASVLAHGTTTLFVCPHNIANVYGRAGIEFLREEMQRQPIEAFWKVPSCVPTTKYESGGATMGSGVVGKLLRDDKYFGLGEMRDVEGLCDLDKECLAKIEHAKANHKLMDGHNEGVDAMQTAGYLACGMRINHGVTDKAVMQQQVASGVYVSLCLGTHNQPMLALLPGLDGNQARRCTLCSDGKIANDIFRYGHINHNLRECVAQGVSVYTALQMATINAADCYARQDAGVVAPGYLANLAVVEDLQNFVVCTTICKGQVVFDHKQLCYEPKNLKFDHIKSFNVKPVVSTSYCFAVDVAKCKDKTVGAQVICIDSIDARKTTLVKEKFAVTADGDLLLPMEQDLCKVAVIERYDATGNVGLGLLRGLGLQKGAIAQSIAYDSHNLIVVGKNTVDMTLAVDELIRQGGGIVAVVDGMIKESFPLPIGGLMSDCELSIVASRQAGLRVKLQDMFAWRVEPFATLSLLSLPILGTHRMTDLGLFDTVNKKFVKVIEM